MLKAFLLEEKEKEKICKIHTIKISFWSQMLHDSVLLKDTQRKPLAPGFDTTRKIPHKTQSLRGTHPERTLLKCITP